MGPPTPGLQSPADLVGRTEERLASRAAVKDRLNDLVLGNLAGPRSPAETSSMMAGPPA
jgi:hypothetical protein